MLSAHDFSRDADSEGSVGISHAAAPELLFESAEHLTLLAAQQKFTHLLNEASTRPNNGAISDVAGSFLPNEGCFPSFSLLTP